MDVQFLQPWPLLLLLLLPWVIYQARGVRVLSPFRRRLAIALRLLLVTLVVLALSEPQWLREGRGLAVFFLMDRSESVPAEQRDFAQTYIAEQLKKKEKDDRAGLILFGKDAVIETAAKEIISVHGLRSVVDARGTDVAGSIRLAMAAFPSDFSKRIVVLTDGNQTEGDAEAEARRAASKGIEVSVVPLKYVHEQEILVREVSLPMRVRTDEPFDVKVLVESHYTGPATLRLYGDGQVFTEQRVNLQDGLNAYVVAQETDVGGFHSYDAVVEAAADKRPDNNRATGFVVIRGVPRVLVLDGAGGKDSQYFASALRAEGIGVEVRGMGNVPGNLAEFEAFDVIALINFSATNFSHDQMLMIESAVRDFGTGLLMIGGENSFGSGGYLNTPVERALPVSMDIKQRKILPSGALVIIMHTVEIGIGNFGAQQISLAALDVLSPEDYMGYLKYGQGGESWLFDLEKVGDKSKQRKLLRNLSYQDMGDMPSFDTTLSMAHKSLVDVPANVKHIVVISDGDPQQPSPALATKIKDAGITISTVCSDHHRSLRNVAMMKRLAQWGGGEAYLVTNNNELPRIFAKEATVVKRGMLVEEPFIPQVVRLHEALLGFSSGFPELLGYVIATPKPAGTICMTTHQDDPLLATWRYGVGKAVAWTSDAAPRWGQQWLDWEGYVRFWTQMVRWLLPENQNDNVQVSSTIEGDRAYVVIDAVDDDGLFMNSLTFSGKSVDPTIGAKEFELRQTAPGRYEGDFKVEDPGSHMVSLQFSDGDEFQGQITTGLAVPFSPEQTTTTHNERIISKVAELGSGRTLGLEDNVFDHNLPLSQQPQPLWPFLLAAALILFFLDIAQRRIAVEFRHLREAWARVVAWIPVPGFLRPAALGPATDEIGSLMQAKARALGPNAPRPAGSLAERADGESASGEEGDGEEGEADSSESLLERLDRLAAEGEIEDKHVAQSRWTGSDETDDTGEAVAEPLDRTPAAGKYTSSLLEAKRRAEERYRPSEHQ